MATPFFTGSGRESFSGSRAKESARRLASHHPDLGYHTLFSAAAYVLRDKRALKDSIVLDEARRRADLVEQSVASRERRFGR